MQWLTIKRLTSETEHYFYASSAFGKSQRKMYSLLFLQPCIIIVLLMSASNNTKNKLGARGAIAPNAPNRKLECREKMGEIELNLLPTGENCPLGH